MTAIVIVTPTRLSFREYCVRGILLTLVLLATILGFYFIPQNQTLILLLKLYFYSTRETLVGALQRQRI